MVVDISDNMYVLGIDGSLEMFRLGSKRIVCIGLNAQFTDAATLTTSSAHNLLREIYRS